RRQTQPGRSVYGHHRARNQRRRAGRRRRTPDGGGSMSTITSPSREPHKLDVDSVVSQARNYTSLGETVSQTLTMAWRALKKMRRNPEQFFDVTFQPLLSTAMFAYIFGGAISGDVESYLPFIIPAIFAPTPLSTGRAANTQLRADMDKVVFYRFNVLPMVRTAPLAGPVHADLLRYTISAG